METDWKKKYEEALSLAKSYYGKDQNEFLDTIFPELRESEDERMIKAIVDALLSHCNSINLLSACGYQIEDVKAWLEKQKDSPMPEDTVIFQKGVAEGRRLEREGQKPAEWSEQDIQYYDAVMDMITNARYLPCRPRDEMVEWFKSLKNRGNFQKSNTNSSIKEGQR